MKTCYRCNIEQPFSNYSKKGDGLSSYCKDCNKKYQRDHYKKNQAYYYDKSKQYISDTLQYIYDYLLENPCTECGESRVAALQFDHIDRSTKSFNISRARSKSIATVKKEIEKCRVLCANCHAVHTAKQFGWYEKRIK